RWDGPMPPEVIDRLKYGSATAAEIARVEDSMHFYRREHGRSQVSARGWLALGYPVMYARNRADSRLYFREWRALRGVLKDLRATEAGLKGAKRVFDVLNPKEPS
ncbi:hypothetical protein LCGC14_2878700, partial [marine sediment metagenome]